MSKKKKISIISISIFLVSLVLGVYGCKKYRKWRTFEGRADITANKLVRYLDLTDTQKATVMRIKNEIIAKRNENKNFRLEMQRGFIAQVRSSAIDRAKAEKQLKRLFEQKQKLQKFYLDKIIEFHSILTPELRNKLAGKLEKLFKKFQ